MTLRTGNGDVRAGQWEGGLAVIELCAVPAIGVVADLAIGREPRLTMVGIGGVVVVLQVTGNTGGLQVVKVAIQVTRNTRQCLVLAGQGKLRP